MHHAMELVGVGERIATIAVAMVWPFPPNTQCTAIYLRNPISGSAHRAMEPGEVGVTIVMIVAGQVRLANRRAKLISTECMMTAN